MDETPEAGDHPPNLKLLRALVTVLMVTMIGGFLVIVALFVIRMPGGKSPPPLPAEITLPEGARATAVTRGRDWFAIVTEDDRILIYGADGTLRQSVQIAP